MLITERKAITKNWRNWWIRINHVKKLFFLSIVLGCFSIFLCSLTQSSEDPSIQSSKKSQNVALNVFDGVSDDFLDLCKLVMCSVPMYDPDIPAVKKWIEQTRAKLCEKMKQSPDTQTSKSQMPENDENAGILKKLCSDMYNAFGGRNLVVTYDDKGYAIIPTGIGIKYDTKKKRKLEQI